MRESGVGTVAGSGHRGWEIVVISARGSRGEERFVICIVSEAIDC